MDDKLAAVAATQGVFLRREALDLSYTDRDLAAARRAKVIVRVRQGAYTMRQQWDAASPEQRHRILARAVLRIMPGRVALSHVTALTERSVDTWGVDLSRVHVARLDGGQGRVDKDAVHHQGHLSDNDIEEVNGLLVVKAPRSLVSAAALTSVESGLVMANSALHQKILTPDEFTRQYAVQERWPRSRHVRLVTRLADGRAESPGETRTSYRCWTQGLPMPRLQFKVYDDRGILVAVVDFLWEELGVLGEFDGKVKYGRLLKPGESAGDVVFAEKVREDLVRELTLLPMVRFIHRDFADSAEMARRVVRASTRRRALP